MEQLFRTPIVNSYGDNEFTEGTIILSMYTNRPDLVDIPMRGFLLPIDGKVGIVNV